MLVKNLIKKLQCVDQDHWVNLQTVCKCRHLKVKCTIRDVKYEDGNVVIEGEEQ